MKRVLALTRLADHDGSVAVPEEDVAARARSIFERLRAQQAGADGTGGPDGTSATEDADAARPVLRWELLPLATAPAEPAPPAAEPAVRSFTLAQPLSAPAGETATAPEPIVAGEAAPSEPLEAGIPNPGPPEPGGPVVEPVDAALTPVTAEPDVTPPDREPDLVVLPEADAVAQEEEEEEVAPAPSPFLRPLPRVLAIANQKGGVGKTTTTVNLGASLAVLGYRVLVVDLDPQGNATTGLGINSRNLDHSIYDVLLHDVSLEDCVEPTTLRNLFVAPSTIDLAGAEIELVAAFSRELRLRRALDEVLDDFDFVLIDCPPSLGLLTVNGLAAATEVVVPIQCEYYALEGLGQLLRNVNLVQGNLNPKLEVSAIVLTMYDARTKLAEQVAGEVRQHFGPKVCRNIVPRTVRLSEAPSFGQPIIVFDPSSRGSLAYRELAKEVSGGAPQRTG